MGTGDGRYPLYVARNRPEVFAIGIEPSLDGLRDTARALLRRPIPNVALILSAVESAPLGRLADDVTVHFPWGTLLAAVLGESPRVLASIAALVKPGGHVRILVSAIPRERRASLTLEGLSRFASCYRDAGLAVTTTRSATPSDVSAARSSWGKRLDAGRTRPAFVIEAVQR